MTVTFIAVCILLPLIVGEFFIRWTAALTQTEKSNFHRKVLDNSSENFALYQGPQMGKYIAHPFWGFQMNPLLPEVNNFGFRQSENIPYAKKKNEFVIGLFGGSVAMHGLSHFKKALENPSVPLNCGRRPKLLNFANEGYSQPSQTNIATYFIENLDATINLDGNNELTSSQKLSLPANYPEFYDELFFMAPDRLKALKSSFAWEARRQRLRKILETFSFLLKSDLVYFLSSKADAWFENKKLHYMYLTQDLTPELNKSKSRLEQMYRGLASWEKYTFVQSDIEKQYNVPAFFFIQPSQYSPDGKLFSDEEKTNAIQADAEKLTDLKKIFSALRDSGKKMHDQGVKVFDLLSLFSKEPETIFIDDCCHINEKGYERLSLKIAEHFFEEINKIPCKN